MPVCCIYSVKTPLYYELKQNGFVCPEFCTIFVIRIDVKLMEVSVNLVYFPFNGGIYNIYGAVDFPRYMTTFDSENKHNKSMINNDTRLFSTNDHKVINTG